MGNGDILKNCWERALMEQRQKEIDKKYNAEDSSETLAKGIEICCEHEGLFKPLNLFVTREERPGGYFIKPQKGYSEKPKSRN